MPDSDPLTNPTSRRAARRAADAAAAGEHAQHARVARARLLGRWFAVVAAVVLVAGGAVAVTAALAGPHVGADHRTTDGAQQAPPLPDAPAATAIPAPAQTGVTAASCDDPAVAAAIAGGTDADVIAAFGGAAALRAAVAGGTAPCIDLAEGRRTWVVVNKQRPLTPVDYVPDSLVTPEGIRQVSGGSVRADAAAALAQLAAASVAEGAGEVAINSTYRSYSSQQRIHNGYVLSLGEAGADLQSARAGFSEHQTGLAIDLEACSSGGCSGLEGFGGTTQADWVAANAWRFGFIVRYEDGYTGTTGYEWEPWHIRYLGPELAQAYHDGGFHTLEDFFGLPPAPDY
ncbi:M15 family metallopeptidase [Microbacterium sp.]|uniref:M15 family metallopeptidase n=1 Tax=Microbacterium sp. TaxID=51671 RepID=UPI0039E6FFF1